jgi:Fe-S-cluster containining protein
VLGEDADAKEREPDGADRPDGDAMTIGALEREVVRASLFTHTALSRAGLQFRELEVFVLGLINVLIERGVIDQDDLQQAVFAVRDELQTAAAPPEPDVMLRVDPEAADGPAVVDCASRLPICKAACCRLRFALTSEEVERGVIRWDLGRPYIIRHDETGMCVHNDPASGACEVYTERPRPCQQYSCATDERIWRDFDRMELNSEWIAENLGPDEPHLLHAMLAAPSASDENA